LGRGAIFSGNLALQQNIRSFRVTKPSLESQNKIKKRHSSAGELSRK
jgi:hypothetical protein